MVFKMNLITQKYI